MVFRRDFIKGSLVAGAGLLAGGLAEVSALAEKRAGKMKITGVELYKLDVELKEPFRISLGTITHSPKVIVVVNTDAGISGQGESDPYAPITGTTRETDIALARDIVKLIKGQNPLGIQHLNRLINHNFKTNPTIKAAFDMAFYDILGKAAGLPLFRLFGGVDPQFITDVTVSLDKPEIMARKAAEWAGKGFDRIKIKLGEAETDEERMRLIRDAVGPRVKIQADANQGWSVTEAVDVLNRIEKYGLELIEQPVAWWDLRGMKFVRDHVGVPVMADESLRTAQDAIEMIRLEAVDQFNIKLMKSGGILEALRIADIAHGAGIPCMVGCMDEVRLSLTAAAHVVASRENIVYADLDMALFMTEDPVEGGIVYDGGRITLPEEPGLGARIKPEVLHRLAKV